MKRPVSNHVPQSRTVLLVTPLILFLLATANFSLVRGILSPFSTDFALLCFLIATALLAFFLPKKLYATIGLLAIVLNISFFSIMREKLLILDFTVIAVFLTLLLVLIRIVDFLVFESLLKSRNLKKRFPGAFNLVRSNVVVRTTRGVISHDLKELTMLYTKVVDFTSKLLSAKSTYSDIRFFLYLLVLLAFVSFALYLPLIFSYFIQDEWYNFGLFNQFAGQKLGFIRIFIQQFTNPKMYGIHFTPLWNTLFFIEYQLFGLHYPLWIFASIAMHITASLLVAYLGYMLAKSRLIALLSGLFFAVTFSHAEAVYWVNTHIQTEGATIFAILSIILWIKALQQQSLRLLLLSIVSFIVGLALKETVFALFPILFVASFLYGRSWYMKKRSILLLISFFVSYFVYRVILGKVIYARDVSGLDVGPLIPPGIFAIGPQLYRLLFYPFKALAQEFVPTNTITHLAELLTAWNYPEYAKEQAERGHNFLTFVQSAGSDMVILFFSIIAILLFLVLQKALNGFRDKALLFTFYFGLAIVASSIVPLLFIAPWLQTLFAFVTFLDSRHLYFTTIGGSLVLSVGIVALFPITKHILSLLSSYWLVLPKKRIVHVAQFLVILTAFLLFTYVTIENKKQLDAVTSIGSERRAIVDTIKSTYPTITDKSIFLIESNRPYYGLAEFIVPFQTNFGYTLLHSYNEKVHYPVEFFTTGFLLKEGVQGEDYKEYGGKGFGYVLTERALLRYIEQYALKPEQVYAFRYDGNAKVTSNTTERTRNDLTQLLLEKQALLDWPTFKDDNLKFSLQVPPDFTLTEDSNSDPNILKVLTIQTINGTPAVHISIYKKPDTIGVRGFVAGLTNSKGQPYDETLLKDINLPVGQFDTWPAVMADTAAEKTYFFNTKLNTQLKQVTFVKSSALMSFPIETFLKTVEFAE